MPRSSLVQFLLGLFLGAMFGGRLKSMAAQVSDRAKSAAS